MDVLKPLNFVTYFFCSVLVLRLASGSDWYCDASLVASSCGSSLSVPLWLRRDDARFIIALILDEVVDNIDE